VVRLAAPSAAGFEPALVLRRPPDAPDAPKQLAYDLTCAPGGPRFATRGAVAGRRGTIEESVEAAKRAVGLAHSAVRHSHGWSRHVTLARRARASLAVVRAPRPGAAGNRGISGWRAAR
jgi:SRSO17 transposase